MVGRDNRCSNPQALPWESYFCYKMLGLSHNYFTQSREQLGPCDSCSATMLSLVNNDQARIFERPRPLIYPVSMLLRCGKASPNNQRINSCLREKLNFDEKTAACLVTLNIYVALSVLDCFFCLLALRFAFLLSLSKCLGYAFLDCCPQLSVPTLAQMSLLVYVPIYR